MKKAVRWFFFFVGFLIFLFVVGCITSAIWIEDPKLETKLVSTGIFYFVVGVFAIGASYVIGDE